jgi:hypothetical protein
MFVISGLVQSTGGALVSLVVLIAAIALKAA